MMRIKMFYTFLYFFQKIKYFPEIYIILS